MKIKIPKTPPKPIFDVERVLLDERDNDDYRTTDSLSNNFAKKAPAYVPTDYKHAVAYLVKVTSSPDTFSSYRRDLERLHLWSWIAKQKSVLKLNPDDIDQFLNFLEGPPESWIGTTNVARFKSIGGIRKFNPLWRPFAAGKDKSPDTYSPSQSSLKATVKCISAYYSYLAEEDIIVKSPIRNKTIKNRLEKDGKKTILRISNDQWDYALKAAEELAKNDPDEHERTLFIINALYGLHLRISELTSSKHWTPRMSAFYEDEYGWWFHCIGKGRKPRDVVVSKQMLKALRRYRVHRGLSELPAPNDHAVLVPNYRRKNHNTTQSKDAAISSTRKIRELVTLVFDLAYKNMKRIEGEDKAAKLKAATVHWLRHTSISEAVKVRDLNHVSKEVGHSDLGTTSGYIDSEQKDHQKSGKNVKY